MVQGVSFTVAAGEKVGIVGRTGSGKSSLIVTLFRIVEANGGSITLDGLDLQSLGLNDVRGRIAAIPQDPVVLLLLLSCQYACSKDFVIGIAGDSRRIGRRPRSSRGRGR